MTQLQTIIIYLSILNFINFIIFWYDKNQAKKNQYRISEKMLLIITFFGGTIGAALAMMLFRHKTSKTSFLLKFFGILIVQLCLSFYFVK